LLVEVAVVLLAIESKTVRIEVDPDFGARVLSLIDLRSGRDWMAKGPQSSQIGEDAIYLADECVGWDECFPTVAPFDATSTALARPLRDHGDLWGRAFVVDSHSADTLTLSRSGGGFRFTRELSIRDATLTAAYAVKNISNDALPFMWALHGLLAVTPEDRIEMAGITAVAASFVSLDGNTIAATDLDWPGANAALGLRLDQVHPSSARLAAKLYASSIPGAKASVGGRNGWVEISWNAHEIGHLGLWLNYGGWPSPGEVHHLALEPTTAPVDHLGQALAQGTATTLAPGARSHWRVTMTLLPPATPASNGPS
jgi:galactose mutarotase-like enzyme